MNHRKLLWIAHHITVLLRKKVPGYTSEWTTIVEDQLEKKTGRLELSGVGGSWGALRLRCEASLFRLYRANSLEVEVRPDTPQPASVLLMTPSNGGLFGDRLHRVTCFNFKIPSLTDTRDTY
ncbi:hypothetical protein NQ315_005006 [Exocentrus adspersus]|uniref:Uncharacterized protein n=1 Tax=Exocentrus adspersus TaxID=1586481 RepID=A0AAV8VQT2_9CUCU|nr:hypothetical protein NQ315_005006 [Exocentrus adspersus]